MKSIYFIIALIFSINTYAQVPELFENDWYLRLVSIDGQEYYPPSNEEVPFIPLNFEEPNSLFSTIVCNDGFGEVTFDNLNFSFSFVDGLTFTLIVCENPENGIYEGIYFGFYLDDIIEPFNYELIYVIGGGGEEFLDLIITSASGDKAYYSDYILSNQEFTDSTFSIFPNPVQDKLFISVSPELNDFTINVFDIYGKLILSENKSASDEKSINLRHLANGMYIVLFENEQGKMAAKKVVKQ